MWFISSHPHFPTEIISGPGRPTWRSPGASRTLIQLFTSNMAISKGGPSTKSLSRALHWDTRLHERLHKGKPASGICRETPQRNLPELHEERPKPTSAYPRCHIYHWHQGVSSQLSPASPAQGIRAVTLSAHRPFKLVGKFLPMGKDSK